MYLQSVYAPLNSKVTQLKYDPQSSPLHRLVSSCIRPAQVQRVPLSLFIRAEIPVTVPRNSEPFLRSATRTGGHKGSQSVIQNRFYLDRRGHPLLFARQVTN